MGGQAGIRKKAGAPKVQRDAGHVDRTQEESTEACGDLAWAAVSHIDADGHRAQGANARTIAVIAVSVHEDYPTGIEARLALIRRTLKRCQHLLHEEEASLWIFPGGYFGYSWHGLDFRRLVDGLTDVVRELPPGAVLVTGVDMGEFDQQVWVTSAEMVGASILSIKRQRTPLDGRRFRVGSAKAAAFVCGEFTGSTTQINGPFFQDQYLWEPALMLADCDLLIDVAHRRVRGSVSGDASRRMVHQRQMERFSKRGTAVLAHHHGGKMRDGRPRNDCASNWIIHRGGEWLSNDDVVVIR